jgi:hypothetical protein
MTPDAPGESDPDEDRPTVIPKFDPGAFARDSEHRQRAQPAAGQPTTAPEYEDSDSEEDRPTVIPEFDPAAFARDSELRQRPALPSTGEPATGESTIDEARRLLQGGDAEQALFLLARLLELAPLHSEASALSTECRAVLERECLSSVGSASAILIVVVGTEELKGLGLDNVSGFLLSHMDGLTDVETLLDLSGLPRLLALRHLRGLVARGIVAVARKPAWLGRCYASSMMTVRARVRNGRLVVDEPTDLPEGTEVELAPVDDETWDLTPEQRAELRSRISGADRGELVPAAEVFARLRGAWARDLRIAFHTRTIEDAATSDAW